MYENEIDIGNLEKENTAEEELLTSTDIIHEMNDFEDDTVPPEEEGPIQPQGLKMIGPDFIDGMIERITTESNFCAFNLGQVTAQASDIEERMQAIATSETILTALQIGITCFDSIRDAMMEKVIGSSIDNESPNSIPAESLSILPSIMSNTISWKPSGPITGDESEWVDISENDQYKDLIGKVWWLTSEKIKGTGIKIKSVQYNKRCKFIRRFNNDNRLAHRMDGQKFLDADTDEVLNPFAIHATTIRFIEFPYIYTEPNLIIIDSLTGEVVNVITSSNIGVNSTAVPKFIQKIIDKHKKKAEKENADKSIGLTNDIREQIEEILNESDVDDYDEEDDHEDKHLQEYNEALNYLSPEIRKQVEEMVREGDEHLESDHEGIPRRT